jgi:rfaE bifunctional protein nucleotidyltransferase chain/domain
LDRVKKVLTLDELLSLRAEMRRQGKQVVFTNGCFDLLHVGHVRLLQAARALGDVLVVGLNDDEAVRALKGAGRPFMPAEERAELLAALEPVDYVIVWPGTTFNALLADLQPDVYCKGGDYAPGAGKELPEKETVERYGGRLVLLPLVAGRSTSGLIRRIRET